ncbi:hypothetical protein CEP52_013447 [Fusarium oligoseptatum]|uniref:NACHT domain-containing protein n=1 Tax=Fusarium oligoseptatum TaxID=2604345 RepID=A0A428STI3_9HYPO|nr:hypothetical protein CEP52_013447 [Fusarium oligoseptatum]
MSSLPPQVPPVVSDPIFDKALAQFKKRLTKKHREIFAQCTIDDVKSQIRHIQNHHGSQRRQKHMGRLSKFIEGMAQLGQVVEVFLNIHNGVAFIWGPIKFLLLTASTWVDSLDTLLEVYGRIGEVLPNLTRYTKVYEKYPSVHTHLEAYYYDILEFHSHALEVFSRPGWKGLFRSTWKTFETQFRPILKNLERHRIMLSEEKLTAVMEETQKQGQSIEDKLDRLNKDWEERDRKNAERELAAHREHLNQQRSIVQNKIDAPDFQDDHEFALQKRHQSTSGNWILSHPLLLEWSETSSRVNRKIYLSGIPGAGKTVLTSRVISQLKHRQLNSKDPTEKFSVAYFYFKHSQPEKRSMVSLLLALLSQLISQDESLLDHVYQTCCTAEQQRLRCLDTVSSLVLTALQSQSLCFVIVDGLDECTEAAKVLEWFEKLMSSGEEDSSGSSKSAIRLFISGQRDGVLEDLMSEYDSIQLETTTGHGQDIETFTMNVAGEIRKKFSLNSEVEQEIVSRVSSRAGGMFLYAQLVVGNLLHQTSKYALKQELKAETFPDGLSQAYKRVIIRVLGNPNKAERDAAKQILGMIMCACRPLHWREVQSKFCIDVNKGEADLDRQLVLTCKQLCGSLVDDSYLEPSFSSTGEAVVDLVHSTAKTYLIQTEEISMAAENAKMALFCAEYLLSRPLAPGISTLEIQQHATKGYYGFQDYAVAFWWQHAQQVLATPGVETEMNQSVLQAVHRAIIDIGELEQGDGPNDSQESIQSLKSQLKRVPQNLRDWEAISICEMRTVAIREAIHSLVNHRDNGGHTVLPLYGPWRYKCPKPWCQFFSSGFDEPQHRKKHINEHDLPFLCDFQGCYASEVGFATETDLKKHARRWHPKEEEPLFPTPKKRTSARPDIMKAAERGDLDTIKIFGEQGIIGTRYRGRRLRRTPLHAAAENGHLQVCRYLTRMGVDVNGNTNTLETALHKSVARRDLEITTFLCDLDNISLSEDATRKTALDYAVSTDPFDKAIITQLLRKATPNVLQNALLLAIRSKRVMAVRYLADNIDTQRFNGFEKPLEAAARIGHLPCLDALLSSGKANPTGRSSAGGPAFLAACGLGKLSVVQRLQALAATTNLKDLNGNSPLHLAAANGHEDIALWILQKAANKADVNIRDKNVAGQTPLSYAAENGHETIVKLLLATEGVEADSKAIDGRTSLSYAARNGHETIVKLLLDTGKVDPKAEDNNNRTPWSLAVQYNHIAVHKLLPSDPMDDRFGGMFDMGPSMELGQPISGSKILDDFDFDSFLHDNDGDDGDDGVFALPEAFSMDDES